MLDLKKRAKGDIESLVSREFEGKIVISDWGNRRTYKVHKVEFKSNPETQTFLYKGKQTTVADYFMEVYKKPLIKD